MEQLPTINNRQKWCCENGCGECRPVQTDFEYSRTEDESGNVIESLTEKIWVSHCCKADLMLWDEDKQDFIVWGPLAQVADATETLRNMTEADFVRAHG